MKKTIKYATWLLILLIVTACSNKKKENTQAKKITKDNLTKTNVDTSFLADKNFIYKNITNTKDIKEAERGPNITDTIDNHLYTDSTFKTTFATLNRYQRSKLIGPFIAKELDVKEKYARDLMTAYFISKQQKLGELQPIIIQIGGDDYGSLTMIILDKNNRPISGFNLEGGMQPGPTEIGDSLISYDKNSYSHIAKNIITTYRIGETDYTDSTKKEIIIDSSVFVSSIDKSGKIRTRQTVKARFRKAKKIH